MRAFVGGRNITRTGGNDIPRGAILQRGLLQPRLPAASQAFPITSWQSGHGWSALGGGTINLNDTTAGDFDPDYGTQCVSVTTNGTGSTTGFRRLVLPAALDFTNALPRLRFRVVGDPARLKVFQVDLGDTSLANFTRWDFSEYGQSNIWYSQNLWQDREWGWDTYPGITSTTGAPNRAAVTSLQIRVADDGTGGSPVTPLQILFQCWDAVPKQSTYPNGVVTFSFDDSYGSQYTYGYSIASSRGVNCVCYLLTDFVRYRTANKLTIDQLLEMQNGGWQISGHTAEDAVHTPGYSGVDTATMLSDVHKWQSWMRQQGLRGWRHMSYAHGGFNGTSGYDIPKMLKAYGILSARTVDSRWRDCPLYPAEPHRMNAVVLANTRTLVSAKAAVDDAKANGSWLHFYGHDLVTGAPATSNEWNKDDFAALLDYCAAQSVPVKTLTEMWGV